MKKWILPLVLSLGMLIPSAKAGEDNKDLERKVLEKNTYEWMDDKPTSTKHAYSVKIPNPAHPKEYKLEIGNHDGNIQTRRTDEWMHEKGLQVIGNEIKDVRIRTKRPQSREERNNDMRIDFTYTPHETIINASESHDKGFIAETVKQNLDGDMTHYFRIEKSLNKELVSLLTFRRNHAKDILEIERAIIYDSLNPMPEVSIDQEIKKFGDIISDDKKIKMYELVKSAELFDPYFGMTGMELRLRDKKAREEADRVDEMKRTMGTFTFRNDGFKYDSEIERTFTIIREGEEAPKRVKGKMTFELTYTLFGTVQRNVGKLDDGTEFYQESRRKPDATRTLQQTQMSFPDGTSEFSQYTRDEISGGARHFGTKNGKITFNREIKRDDGIRVYLFESFEPIEKSRIIDQEVLDIAKKTREEYFIGNKRKNE